MTHDGHFLAGFNLVEEGFPSDSGFFGCRSFRHERSGTSVHTLCTLMTSRMSMDSESVTQRGCVMSERDSGQVRMRHVWFRSRSLAAGYDNMNPIPAKIETTLLTFAALGISGAYHPHYPLQDYDQQNYLLYNQGHRSFPDRRAIA